MAAVVSPIAVIKKAGATEGSSMAVVVSQTATTVSPPPPPIGRVNQECVRSINAILSSLQIKETSKLSNSTAVKTHRSKTQLKNPPSLFWLTF